MNADQSSTADASIDLRCASESCEREIGQSHQSENANTSGELHLLFLSHNWSSNPRVERESEKRKSYKARKNCAAYWHWQLVPQPGLRQCNPMYGPLMSDQKAKKQTCAPSVSVGSKFSLFQQSRARGYTLRALGRETLRVFGCLRRLFGSLIKLRAAAATQGSSWLQAIHINLNEAAPCGGRWSGNKRLPQLCDFPTKSAAATDANAGTSIRNISCGVDDEKNCASSISFLHDFVFSWSGSRAIQFSFCLEQADPSIGDDRVPQYLRCSHEDMLGLVVGGHADNGV